MKKKAFYLVTLLSICLFSICLLAIYFLIRGTRPIHHVDPFYDLSNRDFPRAHLPIIKPVEATRESVSSPWRLELLNVLWIELPKSQKQETRRVYGYTHIEELEKFAVEDGILMAYSSYVDQEADAHVLNDFYHWFVMIPSQNITKGFHTEDEFRQYIRTLNIQNFDWQTPNEAYAQFKDTGGCLAWISDCK